QPVDRSVDGREAGREVADEGRALVGAGLLEGGGEAHPTGSSAPSGTPSAPPRWNHSIAVSMSLSPRPERLISMMSSGPYPLATCSAPATAWAASPAGAVPP